MNEDEKLNLRELLKTNVVEVTFKKVNGDKRVMKCTLIESYLPQVETTSKETQQTNRDTSLAIWDIDSGGWRSFRYDNIISFSLKNEE